MIIKDLYKGISQVMELTDHSVPPLKIMGGIALLELERIIQALEQGAGPLDQVRKDCPPNFQAWLEAEEVLRGMKRIKQLEHPKVNKIKWLVEASGATSGDSEEVPCISTVVVRVTGSCYSYAKQDFVTFVWRMIFQTEKLHTCVTVLNL